MFRFEINHGETLLLPPDLSIMIGRGDQCDFQLKDPSASRVHCRVIEQDGKVTLTDVGSRWGTFVNGVPVRQCDLKPGDRVTIGETVLRLEAVGQSDRTTLARNSDLDRPAEMQTIAPGANLRPEQREPISRNSDLHRGNDEDSEKPHPLPDAFEASKFLGQVFHRYKVQQSIVTTSSGIVFRATESVHSRPVALKIFQPSFFADEVDQQRFERATKTMFGQRHPNIVELYNAGRKAGYCFTVTQLIDGESAVELIQRIGIAGMLDPSTVLQIAVDLCEALRFAESRDIVHRNIKPSNILIRNADNAALLNDLILAKASTASGAEQLTQAGDVPGDVSYMSPEQLGSGHPIDCRSDIYQLGVTLYALLTGRTPFDGARFSDTIARVLTAEPHPVRDLHMATPPQFDTVVLRMLKKNPLDRFQTADELSVALRKVAAETGQQNVKPRAADPRATGWSGALDGLL